MFDTFEPFSTLKKQGFSFAASRYEIWRDGLLVDSAKCLTTIIAVVRPIKETVQIEVHLTNGKSTQIDPLPPKQTNPLAPFQTDPLIPA